MSVRRSAPIAWGLWAVYVVVSVLAPLLVGALVLHPGHATTEVFGFYWLSGLAILPIVTVGALVAARRPGNRIGWIMLAIGLLSGLGGIADAYSEHPEAVAGTPLAGWIGWVGFWYAQPTFVLMFVVLPLLFPTGRLPSPRWRPVSWLTLVALVLLVGGRAFGSAVADNHQMPDAVRSEALAPWADRVAVLGLLAAFAAAVLSVVASLSVRFRRARGVERQQIKWFALVCALVVVSLGAAFVLPGVLADVAWLTTLFVAWLGPALAIGIAILRHNLYDIDRIINRALVYGTLTAATAGSYAVWVVVLQALLQPLTRGSDLAVAGATLAVAALFRPARNRIQRTVDQRFYRHRYDAARTIEAFSARLRDEIDLDTLTAELRTVVQATMQPSHVTVWVRPTSGRRATGLEVSGPRSP